VAGRSFEDSAGTTWEVFQVRRASEASRGVSPGLENGWLAFVSAEGKRRLAPFPASWEDASPEELERLCTTARIANPSHFNAREALRFMGPRHAETGAGERGDEDARHEANASTDESGGEANSVRQAVRDFAHEARAKRLPAIKAMLELKAMLLERYGGADVASGEAADAKNARQVRRWFVEAFYFERQP
jgi:hypothetical protein